MNVISTSKLKKDVYSVSFDDGIIVDIEYKPGSSTGHVKNMCSVGTDGFFFTQGKFPRGNNLNERLDLGLKVIKSRLKRYRRKEENDK
jgi:hypothetical protein